MSPPHAQTQRSQPQMVEPPRASDAIGVALRDAYCRDGDLPETLATLLRQLNGNGGMRATTLDIDQR